MLKIILAEIMKLRKSKIALVSSLIVWSVPLLIILKDFFLVNPPNDYMSWLYSGLSINGVVLPIISGFMVTFLIQREYQDHTIINMLTSTVSRRQFVLSKLIVWFLWYAITLLFVIVLYIFGYRLIYHSAFSLIGVKTFITSLSHYSLLSFIAFIPLLWVSVKQRKIFYPSIMAALLFTVIQISSFQVSEEMLLLASVVPWSAVTILFFDPPVPYSVICTISIVSCGILGIVFSYFTFRNQDQ